MMMEAARTSETLVNFYQTTWRYNPEDNHLRIHRRENLKSYYNTQGLRCSSTSAVRTTQKRSSLQWHDVQKRAI
jgi:hypothetical protein